MRDAFEIFMIQKHSKSEWFWVITGLLGILLIIPAWFWVMKHRKNDEFKRSIRWRDEK